MRLGEEAREATLTSYFRFCKERAAKAFMDWRIQQSNLVKNPNIAKALRLRRLSSVKIYDKEETIFKIYMENEHNFESVKG